MSKKLTVLKKIMKQNNYDFYLVPSTDEHNNEYVPKCWQYRAWISNFDGSTGDLLVTIDKSFLSTDGRYFSQANNQIDKDYFTLLKQNTYESKIQQWLKENFKGKTLAVDPKKINIVEAEKLISIAHTNDGKIIFDRNNLVAKAQKELNKKIQNRSEKVFIHEMKYAGQSINSKLKNIKRYLHSINVECLIETKLDAIMWTLNIRGRDIKNTPLAICYMLVTIEKTFLYINIDKITNKVKEQLTQNNVIILNYENFFNDLERFTAKFVTDINVTNYAVKLAISKNKYSKLIKGNNPIVISKALKNSIEINGSKDAHKKDAVAFIKWWHWIEKNFKNTTEISAKDKLKEFRLEQKNYLEDSFDYIIGYAENGALPHYNATEESNKKIKDEAPLLCDSGGQYKEGTTDITRVLHFGKPSKEHKKYYTLVLKGHLDLGRSVFPKGTVGSHLDVLARKHLWHFCTDYNHGTGHGVGSFLGVHEGPQSINPNSKVELMPGMILSNEPGVYIPNQFGIRIENLCYVKQRNENSPTGHTQFYYFENLTLIPYEFKMIETWMLTYHDKKTINNYYNRIRKEILPLIEEKNVRDFLLFKTKNIQ